MAKKILCLAAALMFLGGGAAKAQTSGVGMKILTREVVGNTVILYTSDGILTAPVTKLWVERNARLEALMEIYNRKFNP